jgi:hypothetical protein
MACHTFEGWCTCPAGQRVACRSFDEHRSLAAITQPLLPDWQSGAPAHTEVGHLGPPHSSDGARCGGVGIVPTLRRDRCPFTLSELYAVAHPASSNTIASGCENCMQARGSRCYNIAAAQGNFPKLCSEWMPPAGEHACERVVAPAHCAQQQPRHCAQAAPLRLLPQASQPAAAYVDRVARGFRPPVRHRLARLPHCCRQRITPLPAPLPALHCRLRAFVSPLTLTLI